MGRLFLSLVLGGGIFAIVGYQMGLFTNTEPSYAKSDDGENSSGAPTVVELGGWLYEPKPIPPTPTLKQDDPVHDPLVVRAHFAVIDKVELSAPIPGKVLFIGEEIPEGAAQVAGVASFVAPPFESNRIPGVRDETVFIYRRLYENELVENRHMVAKMDITKILGELLVKNGKVRTAKANSVAAEAASNEAKDRLTRAEKLYRERVIALEELGSAKLTAIKFEQEFKVKEEEAKLAQVELDQMSILYKQHDIRNDLGVRWARVQKIFKFRGETIREQEPIMVLQNLDRLAAEALVETQFRDRIKEGMRVRLEPIEEQAPVRTFHGHRGEINAVAVTGSEDYPKYLSASEDGTVCVWDQFSLRPLRELMHGDPVRALAVTPPAAKTNIVLTGTDKGYLYLWDLDKPGAEPLKKLDKTHRDAITSVAFSPDGKYFAAGSADARINLYRADDGELLYPFDLEHGATDPHRGAITSLHFTPFGLLVSASRDNTVRIWSLKERGVSLATKPITGRTGTIPQLGVSADGRWMFLDRGKDLQILSAIDGSRFANLQNQAGGIPFDTLAVASPDSSLILTAGAPEGRLQLWRAPDAKNRGFEVQQFVTLERSPVTCAAISPLAQKGGQHAFAVSGTRDTNVYLWRLPSPKDVASHATTGVVTLVGASLDATSRSMRVGVEVSNPDGRFNPGRPVTIVVE